jgi:hypothetical protein
VKTVKLRKKFISDTQAAWQVHILKTKCLKVLLAGTINQSDKKLLVPVISLSGKNVDKGHSKSGSSCKDYGPRREGGRKEVTG